MRPLDLAVVALYAVAMLAVGRHYKARVQTADDYLLGGRRMSPLTIGISLFATLTSTLSYLAYPGEMVRYGPMMFAQVTAFPVVMLIVGWALIPKIMQQQVTSGYELLERRLGLTGRLLGATMFLALRLVWMAAILYSMADKVIVPLLGLDPRWGPVLSAVMGIVTTVYSAEGGMRAVVVTDALQSAIMLIGGIVVIVVVCVDLGSATAWLPETWPTHWQGPVFWFQADVRVTFMGAFLNMAVWMTCTAGADQMAIQRYLSTRDARAARRSLGVHLTTEVLLALLLACVGLAVLAYFTAHPAALASGKTIVDSADDLLPRYLAHELPAGLSGLVIAALLSAAMSSLSSGMNSASAIVTTDFLDRSRQVARPQHENVRLARRVSVAVGLLAVLASMLVGQFSGNLLDLCFKVVNLLTAPMFVLFFLALFVPWSNATGGVAATVVSVSVAVAVAFFKVGGLDLLWPGPLALATGVVTGSAVSLLPRLAGRWKKPV